MIITYDIRSKIKVVKMLGYLLNKFLKKIKLLQIIVKEKKTKNFPPYIRNGKNSVPTLNFGINTGE